MKAANLLINNSGQLQIADFGLARPYFDQVTLGKVKVGKVERFLIPQWLSLDGIDLLSFLLVISFMALLLTCGD